MSFGFLFKDGWLPVAKKTETKVVCMCGGKGAGGKKNILRKDIVGFIIYDNR